MPIDYHNLQRDLHMVSSLRHLLSLSALFISLKTERLHPFYDRLLLS